MDPRRTKQVLFTFSTTLCLIFGQAAGANELSCSAVFAEGHLSSPEPTTSKEVDQELERLGQETLKSLTLAAFQKWQEASLRELKLRKARLEALKSSLPPSSREGLNRAEEEVRKARQNYAKAFETLIRVVSISPGAELQASTLLADLNHFIHAELHDMGVDFREVEISLAVVPGYDPIKVSGIEIIPGQHHFLNRLAATYKTTKDITMTYSLQELMVNNAEGVYTASQRRLALSSQFLFGKKDNASFFHELKHAIIADLYQHGIDHPYHGFMQSLDPRRAMDANLPSSIKVPDGYRWKMNLDENATFSLNMNLFRFDLSDTELIMRLAQNGAGLSGMVAKRAEWTIRSLSPVIDLDWSRQPRYSNKYLSLFTGQEHPYTDIVLTRSLRIGFQTEQTFAGSTIVLGLITQDHVRFQLPLMDPAALDLYHRANATGALKDDGVALQQLSHLLLNRLQRLKDNTTRLSEAFAQVQFAASGLEWKRGKDRELGERKLQSALQAFRGTTIKADQEFDIGDFEPSP